LLSYSTTGTMSGGFLASQPAKSMPKRKLPNAGRLP
jgi:hypothetical protein